MTNWVIHKFGGTSLANAARIQAAAAIVNADASPRKAVVVSAMEGVTNALIELVDLARRRDESYLAKLESLKARHLETLAELLGSPQESPLQQTIVADFKDIREILRGIWLARSCTELTIELVSGYGELWSAQFLCAHLNGSQSWGWLDARQVLVVEPLPAAVDIDWTLCQTNLDRWIAEFDPSLLVITGFVASTHEGMATTLKRNGSDYSAAIFGSLMKATKITIWTDVDGVLSADPRLVPEAVVLDRLSYSEVTEMAYFGAKVIHPSAMGPAIRDGIPIYIRNSFNPTHPGTAVGADGPPGQKAVKGFSTIDQMALINVEGTGMVGVPGVAQRLFGALREVGVSVVMISQASSEHSICFAIPQAQTELAKSTLQEAFFAELQRGQIQTIGVTGQCSVLAVVGDNMVERPGIAAKFFGSLGKAGVNVRAIAQGSSERNISVVIHSGEATRALRAVHSAFYLSYQTISVGLIGPGLIGATFLDQLSSQLERLKADFNLDIRVRGIMNSKIMLLGEPRIELASWREQLAESHLPADPQAFIEHIHADHLPHAAIVDASSSGILPNLYEGWLRHGLHIVTPNKKGNSGTMELYRILQSTCRECNRHYLYETTVGAGLPVINTLRDLVNTGDKIHKIEGVLSGTLSYLFNSYQDERSFSEIVREAKDKGYTEPDPRDDLSGKDVARKLVILAREIGVALELEEIPVENLVPEAYRAGHPDEFLAHLSVLDEPMLRLRQKAEAAGEVLRYVGVIESNRRASVELRSYPLSHPFAGLSQTDNIVAFQSARYDSQALVVRGPGAGPEVTAAGVFADLLRLAAYLGDGT